MNALANVGLRTIRIHTHKLYETMTTDGANMKIDYIRYKIAYKTQIW